MFKRLLLVCAAAAALCPSVAIAQEPVPDAGTITLVRGGLYRVQAGGQTTVFVVGHDGILLVDPLNVAVARWLKQEFATRFPDAPLRYVVYTHYDGTRASGASVFDKGVEIIAHDEFSPRRRRMVGRLPPDIVPEADSHVMTPTATYRDGRTIMLGDATIKLIHMPHSSAEDMTVVLFPAERVLFAADALPVHELPRSMGPEPRRTLAGVTLVEGLEFDSLLTGDGTEGTRADVSVFGDYLVSLIAGVKVGFGDGTEALKRRLTLDRFAGLSGYDSRRESNIEETYASFSPVVTSLHATMQLDMVKVQSGTCESYYPSCQTTSSAPFLGIATGVNVTLGRMTFVGDIGADRVISRRVSAGGGFFQPYEEVFQHREVVISGLLGYNLVPHGNTTATVEVGPSIVFATSATTFFTPSQQETWGGGLKHRTIGFTVGTRITRPLTQHVSVVIPIRMTNADRGSSQVAHTTVVAAAGLLFNLSRSVW